MWLSCEGLYKMELSKGLKPLLLSTAIATLAACGGGGGGSSPSADTTPDAFSFVDQADAPLNTLTTSAAVEVSGINRAADISISGGEYSIDGGAFTSAAGTVSDEQSVAVRATSSAMGSADVDVTLNIGGVVDTFTVTTAADITPDVFSFVDQVDASLNTVITSASITVTGITAAVPISITGGEYSINGGSFTSGAGMVLNGQAVAVKLTSAGQIQTSEDTTLTIGGVSDTFSATTGILVFTNGQAASVVIGQDGFDTNSTPFVGNEDKVFDRPDSRAFILNDYLYLPDFASNRVMGFNEPPDQSFSSANFVIGQNSFLTTSDGDNANQLNYPSSTGSDGGQFFIAEERAHRVKVYNNIPTSDGSVADYVLGQVDFGFKGESCSASGLSFPKDLIAVGNKLIITDHGNVRVLVWNLPITQHGQIPDLVLGQSDFTHCDRNDDNQDGFPEATPTARTQAEVAGVWSDGERLALADFENHRLLIWNNFPDQDFQAADVVIGQSDFNKGASNDTDQNGVSDGVNNQVFNTLTDVDSNGEQLCVSDALNNRVLIWNSFPTTDFTPADVVLGQQNMTLSVANDGDGDGVGDGVPTAQALNNPRGCLFLNDKLIVSDSDNNRYLIYNPQ